MGLGHSLPSLGEVGNVLAEGRDEGITAVFVRGDVYAERWTPDIRRLLHVADPLVDLATDALAARKNVVISGNAGDGKSHLMQTALERARVEASVELQPDGPPSQLPERSVLIIRDASALSDETILDGVRTSLKSNATIAVTVNEGPLASLSTRDPEGFFASVRDVLHARALGHNRQDPDGTLIINLAGRQLTHTRFVAEALSRMLPNVVPCPVCGSARTCPRVVGSELLAQSEEARERLRLLLSLVTDSGTHLSVRDIWVFLADLFFGWVCPPMVDDASRIPGYFWSRVFNASIPEGQLIGSQFDPINEPAGEMDLLLWSGRFVDAGLPAAYPGARPGDLDSRGDRQSALIAFAAAKRARFFFGPDDPLSAVERQSRVPEYVRLLASAVQDPRLAVETVIGYVNGFRMRKRTQRELLLSRHHVMSANRRPALLAASERVPSSELEVRLPYRYESHGDDTSGFEPTTLQLTWRSQSNQALRVDYDTWRQLQRPRILFVDREQEALDCALDLFLGQAPVAPTGDPEILLVDHQTGFECSIRVRSGAQATIELV